MSARTPARQVVTSIGVSLVAMSLLIFEVALTRMFSIQLWYHFTYLAISLALCGIGIAGSVLSVIPAGPSANACRRLSLLSIAFAVAILSVSLAATRLRIDTLGLVQHPWAAGNLLLCAALLAIPFFLGGLVLGGSLAWQPIPRAAAYAANLAGSGAGAIAAAWLLGTMTVEVTIVIAAAVAIAGGGLLAASASLRLAAAHAVLLAAAIVLSVSAAGGAGWIPDMRWRVPFAPGKIFAEHFFAGAPPERTLASATAQVDVSTPRPASFFMASDIGEAGARAVELRGVTQDGTAPTALYRDAARLEQFPALAHAQAATAFVARAAAGAPAGSVLVVGPGGGADVMLALYHGASAVTAVELNPAAVRMVTRDYASYIGHLFSDPRVTLVTGDGRAYVDRTHETFDVIQLSGVDTYSALATGAYSLSENYLYTVEALGAMYARLKPGGYINFSRLMLGQDPARMPRETLRLAGMARLALERMGVDSPWSSIAILQGHTWGSTMIRKGPFTAVEVASLARFAEAERFLGLVFSPVPGDDNAAVVFVKEGAVPAVAVVPPDAREVAQLLMESSMHDALADRDTDADALLGLAAQHARPHEWSALRDQLRSSRDASLTGVRDRLEHRRRVRSFFRTVVQGSPAERDRFVAGYPYDLRPPTDDRPFFFDYFRLSRALTPPRGVRWSTGSEALPEFPVGHVVLVVSMSAVAAIAAVGILLPVRRFGAALQPAILWRAGIYFAGLGCGFMFVELALVQIVARLLGHPTYGLTVGVGALLVTSGIGAWLSERVAAPVKTVLAVVAVGIAGMVVIDAVLLPVLLARAARAAPPLNVVAAVAAVAPTGLLLGLPLPIGLRVLNEWHAPPSIPWAWGINGFCSVAAALAGTAIAMGAGYFVLMLCGAGAYLIAIAAMWRSVPARLGTPSIVEMHLRDSGRQSLTAGDAMAPIASPAGQIDQAIRSVSTTPAEDTRS